MKEEKLRNKIADGLKVDRQLEILVAEGSRTRISIITMITKTNQLWFEDGSPAV